MIWGVEEGTTATVPDRSARRLFERIPDPYRGWIGVRRGRRWLRAVRFERAHNARLPHDAPRVSFYPMRLEPTAALAHVLPRLGIRIAPFPGDADLTVAWHTGTWLRARDAKRLPPTAVNGRCLDISKGTVDDAWAQACGHSIAVDPVSWHGPLVVKPLANAVRGGHVVDGPLTDVRDDRVYQRLVDSRTGDRIHSTRAVLINGQIVAAYEKWRPYPNWFSGGEVSLPALPTELYSPDETDALLRFAQLVKLDYGEIDVVRDNESQLIYAVDANRTPVRPSSLAATHDDAVFGPMAEAFADLFKHA